MLKRTINYKDFDGNPCSDVFYFNLSKSELIELEVSIDGGYAEMLMQIGGNGGPVNPAAVIERVKEMIAKSYGVRANDGKRFIKNDELVTEFLQTLAYDQLFIELCTDSKLCAEFFNGIIPNEPIFPEGFTQSKETTDVELPAEPIIDPNNADDFAAFKAWQEQQNQA